MSFTHYARRTPAEQTKRSLVLLGIFGALFAMVYAFLTLPALRERLPTSLQAKVLEGEGLYHRYRLGDVVLLSKQVNAQKVLSNKSRIVRYRNGIVAKEQTKQFLIKPRLHATIEVETLPTEKIARQILAVKGASDSDELRVGFPLSLIHI